MAENFTPPTNLWDMGLRGLEGNLVALVLGCGDWRESVALVLTRRQAEEIVIEHAGEVLCFRVTEIEGGQVKLGFNAPPSFVIHRAEVAARIEAGVPPPSRG